MFIEVTKGRVINTKFVKEISVSEDGLEITFILNNGDCSAATYKDPYAVKNILDSIRAEEGLFMKDECPYTRDTPQVEK